MSAEVETVRELTRALRTNKLTEKVEMRGTKGVKKLWTGGVEERGTGLEREQGIKMRGRVRC